MNIDEKKLEKVLTDKYLERKYLDTVIMGLKEAIKLREEDFQSIKHLATRIKETKGESYDDRLDSIIKQCDSRLNDALLDLLEKMEKVSRSDDKEEAKEEIAKYINEFQEKIITGI